MRTKQGSNMSLARQAGLQARIKKNYICVYQSTFLDSCINILNSCMTEKDKYYVLFNVLKFEEDILYVKIRIFMKMLNYQFIIKLPKIFALIIL